MTAVLTGTALALAVALALPLPPRAPAAQEAAAGAGRAGPRVRPFVAPLLAGTGVDALVGGVPGLVLGGFLAAAVWLAAARAEPAAARRERDAVRRDLPSLVLLVSLGLQAGAATGAAVRAAARSLPGPAAERLLPAVDRLGLGVDPERVWSDLADDPGLAPLGRALARAERSGAPVAAVVGRLADDLASTARAEVEQRARAVGVRAAVPLGVCLLPAFLLLGIVPLVAALVADLSW